MDSSTIKLIFIAITLLCMSIAMIIAPILYDIKDKIKQSRCNKHREYILNSYIDLKWYEEYGNYSAYINHELSFYIVCINPYLCYLKLKIWDREGCTYDSYKVQIGLRNTLEEAKELCKRYEFKKLKLGDVND